MGTNWNVLPPTTRTGLWGGGLLLAGEWNVGKAGLAHPPKGGENNNTPNKVTGNSQCNGIGQCGSTRPIMGYRVMLGRNQKVWGQYSSGK